MPARPSAAATTSTRDARSLRRGGPGRALAAIQRRPGAPRSDGMPGDGREVPRPAGGEGDPDRAERGGPPDHPPWPGSVLDPGRRDSQGRSPALEARTPSAPQRPAREGEDGHHAGGAGRGAPLAAGAAAVALGLAVGRDPDEAVRLAPDPLRHAPEAHPPDPAEVRAEHEQPRVALGDHLEQRLHRPFVRTRRSSVLTPSRPPGSRWRGPHPGPPRAAASCARAREQAAWWRTAAEGSGSRAPAARPPRSRCRSPSAPRSGPPVPTASRAPRAARASARGHAGDPRAIPQLAASMPASYAMLTLSERMVQGRCTNWYDRWPLDYSRERKGPWRTPR